MLMQAYDIHDRIMGAYLGATAGDALGGPVEAWHAHMIKAVHGKVDHFLPYTGRLHPGYALHPDPGAITDDTFIKNDFAHFVFAHPYTRDRTPENLVKWMLANAHFEYWWPPAVVPLRKIESGEFTIQDTKNILMGGGAAWWTPIGLAHAGDPQAAYAETAALSEIWRKPFEQNMIASVQAAVAASVAQGATLQSVSDTLLSFAGPLARKLLIKAQRIALENMNHPDEFVDALYAECLVKEATGELDGEMPTPYIPDNPYKGATGLWAEQIPLAFAAFTFGEGHFLRTMTTVTSIGRDTDSIASTCGSWIGGLVGLKGLPQGWVETMQWVNRQEMDLVGIARRMADVAAQFAG